MKNIVIIKGSPRKRGNSSTLADAFAEEAKKLGANVTVFDTAFLHIGGCRSCYGCIKKGECCFHDDFQPIAAALMAADGIVIASPVYWYTFSAQIKSVIDRWFSLYAAGKDFAGKKAVLLACGEEETNETFTGIRFSFKKTMELMKAHIAGEVLVPKVSAAGDIKHTDGEARARALAREIFEK